MGATGASRTNTALPDPFCPVTTQRISMKPPRGSISSAREERPRELTVIALCLQNHVEAASQAQTASPDAERAGARRGIVDLDAPFFGVSGGHVLDVPSARDHALLAVQTGAHQPSVKQSASAGEGHR